MPTENLAVKHYLLIAAVSLIACAILGGFSGCDISLAQWANGGGDHSARFAHIGIAAGLAIGMLVFLWDRVWAQQGSTYGRRYKIRIAYGTAWLLVAAQSFRTGGRFSRGGDIYVADTIAIAIGAIFAAIVGLALIARAVVKLHSDQRQAVILAETGEYPR